MTTQILTIIISLLAVVIGLWKRGNRIKEEKRKQAEQARKDLDEAHKNDSPSDFIDGFSKL